MKFKISLLASLLISQCATPTPEEKALQHKRAVTNVQIDPAEVGITRVGITSIALYGGFGLCALIMMRRKLGLTALGFLDDADEHKK